MTIALSLLAGAVIGALLGLLGGGGSILAVPALVYGIGLNVNEAVAISLLVVGLASLAGTFPKLCLGQVNWRVAGIFATAGIPATFAGSALSGRLSQQALMIGFATVMTAVTLRILAAAGRAGDAAGTRNDGDVSRVRSVLLSISAALTVGLLTGLFGVGGGFLVIPALVLMLGLEMPVAIGTSLVVIAVNSAAGFVLHVHHVSIPWSITAAVVGSAVIGSLVAGHFGRRVPSHRLQRWFALLVLAVAVYTVVHAAN
ncbi:sulfite exporter TauE/SafE family protein [Mycolicibacterium goodii]|uniref:sulfite exporter TauE/SafE family protein n=1 Tax=Mycolicibacterium goodii TaxID=134601 RepID=UPI001BDCCBE2|nr:sulfite exporter TauE/SafE family protein [Mycolicibacterium goodii]MBU8816501.1 sulfite exporter TauE/SafE family protein [Mycolicibacterium goodii]MBU8831615.1 sulfite exporter TauE/SafE family protein [Mycolicibacterium goodii]